MAANTVEDLMANVLKTATRFRVTIAAKVAVMFYGGLAIGVAYLAQVIKGPVTQIAVTAFGACGGPVTGLFFLGAMFPTANWIGALVGGSTSLIFNLWIAFGAVLYRSKPVPLPPNPISMCYVNVTDAYNDTLYNHVTYSPYMTSSMMSTRFMDNATNAASVEPDKAMFLYELSYLWYGLIGFLVSIVTGLLVSACTSTCVSSKEVEPELLFFWCRRFWKLEKKIKLQPTTDGYSMRMQDIRTSQETLEARLRRPVEITYVIHGDQVGKQ
ncbi:hypothetical protein ScPMuIL_014606 [Solemya velum]